MILGLRRRIAHAENTGHGSDPIQRLVRRELVCGEPGCEALLKIRPLLALKVVSVLLTLPRPAELVTLGCQCKALVTQGKKSG